jgi:hypothetical protein
METLLQVQCSGVASSSSGTWPSMWDLDIKNIVNKSGDEYQWVGTDGI